MEDVIDVGKQFKNLGAQETVCVADQSDTHESISWRLGAAEPDTW
jgi:hypothetical protein